MTKILISACLLGNNVRYDGKNCLLSHPRLQQWIHDSKVVAVCPEVVGGLPVPRLPAEICGEDDGNGIWNNHAKVVNVIGQDVTEHFKNGANKALELAQLHHIKVAILKARSPSCGSLQIYNGEFNRTLVDGVGVTTALLRAHGIQVFSEEQIDEALDMAEFLTTQVSP